MEKVEPKEARKLVFKRAALVVIRNPRLTFSWMKCFFQILRWSLKGKRDHKLGT
jgi:hypothetical protein